MLCFAVRERAEGTGGEFTGTAVRDVAEFPALLAFGVLGGGEHLLHSAVLGEEVEGGEEGESIWRGHRNNHGGCCFVTARFRVWVELAR